MRNKETGEPEENYMEAIRSVNVSIVPTKISSEVSNILKEASSITPCPSTKSFWLMAKSLQEFANNNESSLLPVSGIIPDMTADSEKYIKIQNL